MKTITLFGENVRRFRANAGVSQRELARRVGISSVYLCYIEAGARKPSLEVATRIARALNQPLREFF
jgi:transcriptional regulator with XRE-family HTH domain